MIRRATVAALLAVPLLAAAPAQAAPAGIASLTVSAAAVNTDAADVLVTVRARITDPDGVTAVAFHARHQATATTPTPGRWDAAEDGATTRVSGTAADGVWQGRVRVPRSTDGTLGLEVYSYDGQGDQVFTTAQLQALGVTSRITARSTLAVPRMTGLKGRSLTRTTNVGGVPVVVRDGQVTFTWSGAGYAGGIEVLAATGCSPTVGDWFPARSPIVFNDRQYGICRLELRPVNGRAAGPKATLTFL